MLRLNKTYNEDCKDTMKRMPDNFIDLTVTSPPYDDLREYKGYSFDFKNIAKELFRVTKKGGVVVWVVGDATIKGSETGTSFKQALYFKEIGFNLHDTMIYEKLNSGVCGSQNCYVQSFEYMFVFSKGKIKTVNIIRDCISKDAGKLKYVLKTKSDKTGYLSEKKQIVCPVNSPRKNVWLINTHNNESFGHPAVFPEKLVLDHIDTWTNEGDLVYDCFMGSGTTAKIAHLLCRRWLGSETSKEYVKLSNKRMKEYKESPRLFKHKEIQSTKIQFFND